MIAIVSACMLGINCRYDGKNVADRSLLKLVEAGEIVPIPVCPEQLGGLPTPRKQSEIVGGDGFDVIEGRAKVVTKDGEDITVYLVRGAEEVLKIAKLVRAEVAIMRNGSPSCGCGIIYDGTFSGRKVKGFGVTSAMLMQNGFKVVDIKEFKRDNR